LPGLIVFYNLVRENTLLGLAICLYLAKIFQIFATTWKKVAAIAETAKLSGLFTWQPRHRHKIFTQYHRVSLWVAVFCSQGKVEAKLKRRLAG